MPRFFVEYSQVKGNKINILGEDINHIKNVLRKNIGETIEICNKDNQENFLCEIIHLSNEGIECEIIKNIETSESNVEITVFQGLPKADKMELIIQKSVELGAFEITPVEMKRCIVKISGKDEIKKIDRWQKISEVAAKQSGRNIIPKINNIINVEKICNLSKNYDIVLVAYENEKEIILKDELRKINKENRDTIKIAIVIGPEGGLDDKDVQKMAENGAKIVTLGKRILRTETVALNMISNIMYELEN